MNISFLNLSTSEASISYYEAFEKVFQDFFLCLIISLSLVGNAMILIAVYKFRSLQTITNVFIVNLGAADLLLALLAMPFTMVSSVTRQWVFGNIMCNIQAMLNSFFCTASITTLTFVSIERYVAICCPLRYKGLITPFAVKIMICCIWLHGAICAVSTFPFSRFGYLDFEFICTVDWTYNIPYTICFAVVFLGIPFSISATCYCIILKIALKQKKQINFVQVGEISTVEKPSTTVMAENSAKKHRLICLQNKAKSSGSYKENQHKRQAMVEHKAAMMVALVVGTFMACWFPHAIGVFCLLDPICHWSNRFYVTTTWLAMLNSALNSVIYGLMSRSFRQAFKSLLCCSRLARNLNVSFKVK